MRLINRVISKWWWAVAIGFVAQGLAILEAYQERGKLAYGGEMLIAPMVLIVVLAIETRKK